MGRLSTLAYVVASGLAFAGVGCASVEEQRKEARVSLEKSIEREVRKHGSWTRDVLRNDYTIASVGSRVGFAIEGYERISLRVGRGQVSHAGAFDPAKRLIILPESAGEGIVDAVDHELGHVIMRVMTLEKEYLGPSIQDIEKYCALRIQKDDLAAYRDVAAKEKEQALFAWLRGAALKGHSVFLNGLDLAMSAATSEVESLQKEKIEEKTKLMLGEEWSRCEEAYDKLRVEREGFLDWMERFKGKSYEYHPRDMADVKGHWDAFNMTAEGVARAYNRLRDEAGKVRLGVVKDRIQYYERRLREDKEKGRDTKGVEYLLEHYQNWLEPGRKYGEFGWGVLEVPKPRVDVREYNLAKFEQLVGGDEMFARMVDSLASCHFGPLKEMCQFELNEDDLAFLSGFTWRKERVFGVQIEKYNVGKRMKADGVPPQEIRALLEHAETFNYKGKSYSWPKSNFHFRGELPLE